MIKMGQKELVNINFLPVEYWNQSRLLYKYQTYNTIPIRFSGSLTFNHKSEYWLLFWAEAACCLGLAGPLSPQASRIGLININK